MKTFYATSAFLLMGLLMARGNMEGGDWEPQVSGIEYKLNCISRRGGEMGEEETILYLPAATPCA